MRKNWHLFQRKSYEKRILLYFSGKCISIFSLRAIDFYLMFNSAYNNHDSWKKMIYSYNIENVRYE